MVLSNDTILRHFRLWETSQSKVKDHCMKARPNNRKLNLNSPKKKFTTICCKSQDLSLSFLRADSLILKNQKHRVMSCYQQVLSPALLPLIILLLFNLYSYCHTSSYRYINWSYYWCCHISWRKRNRPGPKQNLNAINIILDSVLTKWGWTDQYRHYFYHILTVAKGVGIFFCWRIVYLWMVLDVRNWSSCYWSTYFSIRKSNGEMLAN